MYESIINRLHNFKNDLIMSIDQYFDYIKTDQNKITQHLFYTFVTNDFLPTIIKTNSYHTYNTNTDWQYLHTTYPFDVFTKTFCDVINSKTQEKTIVLAASPILRYPLVTKGLITLPEN